MNPIKENFEENIYIGPAVADFRRFIAHFEPRPKFKHFILACGTVIRGDIIEKTPAGEIKEEFIKMRDEAQKINGLSADEVNRIYTIISENSKPAESEISIILTNQKIWLVQMLNRPFGAFIMNLAPGESCDDAAIYGLNAYRADMIRPTIIAIMTYSDDGYDIHWPYGKPSYHWPNKN